MQWRHPGPALKNRSPDKTTLCEDLWEGLWPPWKQGTLWKTHTESVWWQSLNGLGRTVSSVGLWERETDEDSESNWRKMTLEGFWWWQEGGSQPNSCVMGKRKRKQSVNILFDIWMGAGKLEGTSYKLKTRLRVIVKWFKTTETWWGLRVGLLFSSKQSLNVWCPVHRDYETINKTSQWGDVCFYI